MSDAIRNYTGTELAARGRRKAAAQTHRRRGRGRGCLLFFLILLLIAGILVWITWDNYDIERLLPARTNCHIVVHDPLNKRARLAESRIWTVFPESWGLGRVPEILKQDFGMPPWVLNNVFPDTCHILASDLKTFSDPLLVTRMTFVGSFLEHFSRFLSSVEADPAGGLDLRRIPEAGLYYAVRGRILLVSRSRDALIHALALRPEDAIGRESIERITEESGSEDLCGTVTFKPDDFLGGVFKRGAFALRLDAASGAFKCHAVLAPEMQEKFDVLVGGLKPRPLQIPPEGLIEISMDLGKPVQELWTATGKVLDKSEAADQLWNTWVAPRQGAETALPNAALSLLAPLGPGVRLSLRGIDLNEMFPMPELVATFDCDPPTVEKTFETLPQPPPEAMPWDSFLRYDSEKKQLTLPLIGGPSIQPTAVFTGNNLLVSSSRTVAETLLAGAAAPLPLPDSGNLWIRVKPRACIQSMNDVVALLAESKLLNDASVKSFQDIAADWTTGANVIDEASALLAYDSGELSLNANITCR